MAALIAFLSCLFFLGSASAAEPLTAQDWQMEAAFFAAGLVDYGQTRDIKNHRGMYETNPFLGRNPSDVAIRNYFISSGVAHAAVSYLLPRPYRAYWQAGTLAIELGFIAHNRSIGLRVSF